ncbi:unnamed protein product, partial [Closterium sp. NIES-54]
MASLRVLAFDHEGRPVQFDTWLDNLQLYLLSDSRTVFRRLTLRQAPILPLPPQLTVRLAHSGLLALYDVVVARYSSPATAALGRLLLPYLFPGLLAFATVEDLVSHLHTSDARYRATVPAEFLDRNQPPMFITLYFIVTRLPDSLRSVLLVALHARPSLRGTPPLPLPPPTPLPLLPTPLVLRTLELLLLVRSTAAARARVAKVVEGAAGVVVGAVVEVVEAKEVVAAMGVVAGVGALVEAVEAAVGVAVVAAVGMVVVGLALSVVVLEVASVSSSSVGARPSRPSSFTCGRLHTEHRCFSLLDDAWCAEFGDDVELHRWAYLLSSRVAIFDLDFDAILSAMYALSVSAEGDCYRCVPPDPGIAAPTLGARESGTLPGIAPAEALHTFTLDSGASHCLFRDSTTLTPLPAPVPVRLADPFLGPVIVHSSTVLPCLARVSICTCTRTGRHLATFTRRPGSSLYTLATEPSQVAAPVQVSASGQVAPRCSCRLLSHQTLLWHHRLGHPSLPRLRGMHSYLLVSGLPRSLPPLPPSPAPPCLPCVEGWQRAAPDSSSFPPTTSPLQTLHMDVWGPARVTRQGRKRYFLPVVDDYTRGGEFSYNLLWDFCRGEGILLSFTLPDSPQQNVIAECRIGLVMEVARTSMIHAVAPHFLWPFAVWYIAHQLKRWPRVSLPETSPTLCWTGKVGDASVFWGPAPSGVSQVDPPPSALPGEVAVDSGAARGTVSGGAEPGGAEPGGAELGGAELGGAEHGGAETGGAEPEGVEPGGAESEGAESRGAEPQGASSFGGSAGASPRLSPLQLREWLVWCTRLRSGATRVVGARAAGAGGAGVLAGASVTRGDVREGANPNMFEFAPCSSITRGTVATGPGGARTQGTAAAGTSGVGGAGARDITESGAARAGGSSAGGAGAGGDGVGGTGAGAGGAGAGGAGAVDLDGAVRPRLYFVPLLQQSSGLTERREPLSRPVSPVRTARRVPRLRPPPVPGTHAMALCPSSVPLRVPQLAPPKSSLPEVPGPESNRARAASPTVSRLLATTVTDPSFESTAASALVAELLEFAAAYHLDYATALVAKSASASPPSVG